MKHVKRDLTDTFGTIAREQRIVCRPASQAYRDNFDRIFRQPAQPQMRSGAIIEVPAKCPGCGLKLKNLTSDFIYLKDGYALCARCGRTLG
jgi:hypothetical protein